MLTSGSRGGLAGGEAGIQALSPGAQNVKLAARARARMEIQWCCRPRAATHQSKPAANYLAFIELRQSGYG